MTIRTGYWKIATDLPSSFRYAFQGIRYGLSSQRNFRIHCLLGTLTLVLSFWLELSRSETSILVLTIASVLILELINTSIEAVVDLAIGPKFHPLAKIAKDCAAAAVVIASISALVIAFLVLFPPLLVQLGF